MARVIEAISEWSGKITSWACVALILAICYGVTVRYVFNSPADWAVELPRMLGFTIAVMGWAYTHRYHGHVRVDVIYTHLSPRKKAIIDVLFFLLFFVPLTAALVYFGAVRMMSSWELHEVFSDTVWKPPTGPVRTIFLLGVSLFVLQGLVQFSRDFRTLVRRNKAND